MSSKHNSANMDGCLYIFLQFYDMSHCNLSCLFRHHQALPSNTLWSLVFMYALFDKTFFEKKNTMSVALFAYLCRVIYVQ